MTPGRPRAYAEGMKISELRALLQHIEDTCGDLEVRFDDCEWGERVVDSVDARETERRGHWVYGGWQVHQGPLPLVAVIESEG